MIEKKNPMIIVGRNRHLALYRPRIAMKRSQGGGHLLFFLLLLAILTMVIIQVNR